MLAVALGIALLACLSTAEGQQPGKVPRVGFLYFGSRQIGPGPERYAAFWRGCASSATSWGRTFWSRHALRTRKQSVSPASRRSYYV
jgi:hypothetical protein